MAASNETLEDLHKAVAEQLLTKIRGGECTAADLNVARAFLRDNKIEGRAVDGTPLKALTDELPYDADDDVIDFTAYGR